MPRSQRRWPTRRGKRRPLDVVAAQEELARVLRHRFLDAIDAEKVASAGSTGSGTTAGVDATRHFTVYSKALDGLTKLQLEIGQLERGAPGRGGRDAVPSAQASNEYSPEERRRMGHDWVMEGLKPAEAGPMADRDPAGDDA